MNLCPETIRNHNVVENVTEIIANAMSSEAQTLDAH